MNKKEIVRFLEEIGTMLELKGENPFKSRAYFNAARAIDTMKGDVTEMILTREIEQTRGIGKAISDKLYTRIDSGSLPYYDELKESIPAGLFDMLKIPGLGPKKVKTLYEKLGICTIGELEYACKENRLRDLEGFGQRSQDKILEGIKLREQYSERYLFPVAVMEAEALLDYLKKDERFQQIQLAGSLRRRKETVKDLDIVAACEDKHRSALMELFTGYPSVNTVTGKGSTKSSVILDSGMGADLRLVSEKQFPFALHHFTGSKEHNTAMRRRAKSRSLTMNEYGLFPPGKDRSIECKNEGEIFKALDLNYIPPELRENSGEIEAASEAQLPGLVEASQITGIFHVHTTYSDGANSIEEMAKACKDTGYIFLGITDHSKSAFYANGLSEKRITEQQEEIDKLNRELNDFRIFKGIEVDILPDGSLDYSDDVLESFDFVIASVHSNFRQSEKEMTARICRALEHPAVTMLGHPTGRLLLGREAYALDMERVLETAAKQDKVIEINANPHRLDLDWRWGRRAKELGIKSAINPDAHSVEGLNDTAIGVGIARKAWFTTDRILNTYSVRQLETLFRK